MKRLALVLIASCAAKPAAAPNVTQDEWNAAVERLLVETLGATDAESPVNSSESVVSA